MFRNLPQISLSASPRPLAISALLVPIACGAESRVRRGHCEIFFPAVSGDRPDVGAVDYAGPYSAFSGTLPVISHD
jgi:hypothetical protein